MSALIASPNITVSASAGNVPVEMDKVTRALDSISSKPLDELRDRSEAALNRTNRAISDTVDKLEALKRELANSGGVNNRLFKGVEADIGKLSNLKVDDSILGKLRGVYDEIRDAREAGAKALSAPLGGASGAIASGAIDDDPTSDAAIAEARKRAYGDEKAAALASVDEQLRASRQLADQKSRAIAEQQAKERAAAKDRRADFEEQFKASRELDAQKKKAIDDELKRQEASRDKRRKLLGDVTGKAFDVAGINLPDKATGAIGVVGAAVSAALVAGQAGANIREQQRTSGISGGAASNAVYGVQQLPILKQLSEAGGEFLSTWTGFQASIARSVGMDGTAATYEQAAFESSPSANKADLDRLNEAAAIYEKFRVQARDLAIEEGKVLRGNAATVRALDAQFAGLSLGGKAKQRFEIAEGAREAVLAAGAKRDDTKADADRNISDIAADFARDSENIGKTIGGGSTEVEREAARKQLIELRKQRDAAIAAQKDRKAAADKAFDEQKGGIDRNAAAQDDVVAGKRENTGAVVDTIEGIDRQVRTISGDPFAGMRKSFDELKPTAESLAAFEAQLGRYKVRLAEVDKEARRFAGNKGIDDALRDQSTAGLNPIAAAFKDDTENVGVDREKAEAKRARAEGDLFANAKAAALFDRSKIGLNPIDAAVQDFRNQGGTEADAIKLRVELEANAKAALQVEIDETLKGIKGEIGVTLARNAKERIAAEVEERDRQLRGPDGKRDGLSDQQRADEIAARTDKFYAGEAARTRESAKTPQQRLAEATESLGEQYRRGFIDEREARRGLGDGLKDYADAVRTSRPELLEAGSAQADQLLAVAGGGVIDASKPEIQLAKEANELLKRIVEGQRSATPVRLT